MYGQISVKNLLLIKYWDLTRGRGLTKWPRMANTDVTSFSD